MARRRRILVLSATGVLVATLCVLAMRGSSGPSPSVGGDAAAPQEDHAVVGRAAETPTAAERDETSEAAARRAAVGFLELTEEVVAMSPDDGAAVQRSIATERSGNRLSAEVADQLALVQQQVPEGVTVRVAPMGISSVSTGNGWEVSIWYAEVIVYGNELAVEQWRTATYSLAWEHGQWLMDDLSSVDGPTPVRPAAAIATPTLEFVAAVADFDDTELVP